MLPNRIQQCTVSNSAKHKTNKNHIGNIPECNYLSNHKESLNQIISVLKQREERISGNSGVVPLSSSCFLPHTAQAATNRS